jgi:hypothetical protein
VGGNRFQDQEHLYRVAVLFVAGLLVFMLLKTLLVPRGFGVYGHYRAGALADNRARPIAFAGRATCEACHTDAVQAATGGKHAGIGCEACHGALARHAQADDPAAAKPARPTAELCPACHTANVGKPAGFPQVQIKEHAAPGTCLECHRAHQPAP